MALVKQHPEIFEWLLNKFSCFWPATIFDEWFKPILLTQQHFFEPEYLQKMVQVVLQSRTMVCFFGNMSFKKQRVWLSDLINDLQSSGQAD